MQRGRALKSLRAHHFHSTIARLLFLTPTKDLYPGLRIQPLVNYVKFCASATAWLFDFSNGRGNVYRYPSGCNNRGSIDSDLLRALVLLLDFSDTYYLNISSVTFCSSAPIRISGVFSSPYRGTAHVQGELFYRERLQI